MSNLTQRSCLAVVIMAMSGSLWGDAANGGSAVLVQVSDSRLRDAFGREILLHGVSVISKSKAEGYISRHTEADYARLREWGMNCIRLGIIWDGLEPEPGRYDEEYLSRIDERVAWARANGVYVFLDMHQDLFSVKYSDGAPEWATLDGGKPHLTGPVWSDAYLLSPAVQQAFDSFWADAPAPDGVGIQEHYARLWRMLAERYAGEPAIVGFDIMNEPFMGSAISEIQPTLLKSDFAKQVLARLGRPDASPTMLLAMWMKPKGRSTLMGLMNDMDLYKAFLDAQSEICTGFEREQLMAMYQRVANAIREADPHHILMLETNYHANMGVYSAIAPLTRADGSRDPQVAYVPHGYDIVVDTPDLPNANFDRLRLIFSRHGETAQRLGMPLVIGEWGGYGGAGAGVLPGAHVSIREFERLRAGDIYWEYGAYLEESAYRQILQRPIPLAVAGNLESYAYEPATGRFECSWTERADIAAPTRIYLPDWTQPDDMQITITPAGAGFRLVPVSEGSGNRYLEIEPRFDGRRRVTVQRELIAGRE